MMQTILAIDYNFVGIVFAFVVGFTMFLLAYISRNPSKPVFYLFASISLYFCGQLFLMAYTTSYPSTIVIHYFMWMIAIVSFILFVAHGAETLGALWEARRRRRLGIEEDEF